MNACADGVLQVEVGPHHTVRQSGAGVVWARDAAGGCLVVSNAHVATGEHLSVMDRHNVRRAARLLARDAVRDIAVMLCEDIPASWRALPPETNLALRPGQVVMAIGHPLGVAHALSTGVVHAIGPLHSDVVLSREQRVLPWVQMDLKLAPGNSGGPVLTPQGHMVGISTMIVRGLGLAIPIQGIDEFVRQSGALQYMALGWTRYA